MNLLLSDPAFLSVAATVSGGGYDPGAQAYITAVEAADTAAGSPGGLEAAVKDAINAFVVGCKADGIWDAIKASCILAGARTLNGALQPLVGTAPDKYGTEGNWNYNRKTGLQGDGSTNYLDSNRSNAADPQNSNHNSAFLSTVQQINTIIMGAATNTAAGAGGNALFTSGSTRCRANAASPNLTPYPAAGFLGMSRSDGANYTLRHTGQNVSINIASDGLLNENLLVYKRQSTSPLYTTSRIAFYSIGESLDLALLDARVTALMNAFGAAIL